jgi:G:T-mismatch repair DNA endonuclease (very short patch repair protein)
MCIVLFITSKFGKNVRREDRNFRMGLNEISFDVCIEKPCAIHRV